MSLVVALVSLFVALKILDKNYGFYPKNRVEIIGPLGKLNRAFTVLTGFRNTSVYLLVDDRPSVPEKPVKLADLYSELGDLTSLVYWSKDGSLVAVQVSSRQPESAIFKTAYDFSEHRHIGVSASRIDQFECNRIITKLMSDRGGVGPVVKGIEDGKIEKYSDDFPPYNWILPSIVMSIGLIISVFIWSISKNVLVS